MIGVGMIKAINNINVNIIAVMIRTFFWEEIIMAIKIFKISITEIPKKKLRLMRFIIL